MKRVVDGAHIKFSYVVERDDDGNATKCAEEEFHNVELVLYDSRRMDGVFEVRILGDIEEDGDATSEEDKTLGKSLDEDNERA